LINREWQDHFVGLGLAERVPKDPRITWRKHVEKGIADTGKDDGDGSVSDEPQESGYRVLQGGLD
jgi:hypothetical protein